MADQGYIVEAKDVQNLYEIKAQHQVPNTLEGCHTAIVDGYVIEGHVPVAEVDRLLSERPDIIGLAVPGMPMGSPGMGNGNQPFDGSAVLLAIKGRGRRQQLVQGCA